ncbi:B-box zinc finger protein [Caldilinea sp.]|jgi:hypothetical protein|uniref:B-box zinc finger protein n=1 Tax=Caldilinea sp. TaxID=2293560 RepID=UPI0021DDDF53|nr:B-box zinc finger protein [Caldilinea sp.]GIV69921.1 MAG: hypothetical protein KatS3mg048_2783 [Caldilinea sp.]
MTTSPSNPAAHDPADVATAMYCANHPDTETYLRCNKCGKPICLKCAVLTEVGYRCKECIREQQNVFYNAATADNLIAFAVAAGVTLIAWPLVAWLFRLTGFFGWILAILIGSGAGASLAQMIRKAVGRRRGRYIRHFTLAGIVVGLALSGLLTGLLFGSFFSFFSLGGLLFLVLAIVTAYQTLR